MRRYSTTVMKVNLPKLPGANASRWVSSGIIKVLVLMFSDNKQTEAVSQNGDQQQCPESEPSQLSEGEEEEDEEEDEVGEEETYKQGQEVEAETPEEEEVKVEWPTGVHQASDKDLAKLSIKEGVSLYRCQMM